MSQTKTSVADLTVPTGQGELPTHRAENVLRIMDCGGLDRVGAWKGETTRGAAADA